MQPTSPKIELYFQQRARQFDALYAEERDWRYYFNRLFRRALYQRVRLTVEAFRGLDDFTLLDVGCGSGRNSLVFLKCGARRVVGIDFSENMIRMAQDYCREQGVAGNCEFIRADVLAHPFRERFDVVVALGVFDYIRDPHDLLLRMRELATRRVVASFPGLSMVRAPLRKLRYWIRNCPVYFSSRKRLQRICRKIGLEHFELVPVAGRAGWLLIGRLSK